MLPITSKDVVRFTPESARGEKPPVYLIAVPTMKGKAAYTRELLAEGVTGVGPAKLWQGLKDAIAEVVADKQQKEILGWMDRIENWKKKEPPRDLIDKVADVEQQILAEHQEYARLYAENNYAQEISSLIACRMFLKGVENLEVEFKTDRQGYVEMETLESLPLGHVSQIGQKIQALLFLPKVTAKN